MLTIIVPGLGMSFEKVKSGKGLEKVWKYMFKIVKEP